MVFGFSRKSDQPVEAVPVGPARPDAQAPKGRPTPSRRQAEAGRREARRIPSDPKAAKRAQKERARKERQVARDGMMAGDERYLPVRDRGPVRGYVRDYVDGRRRMSEYFLFIALGILAAGFARNPQVASTVSLVWFIATGIIAVEMTWTLVRLSRQLRERWPDKADRKGTLFYAGMRCLQIRKLRVPPPQVKARFFGKARG